MAIFYDKILLQATTRKATKATKMEKDMIHLCFSEFIHTLFLNKNKDCGGEMRFALDFLSSIDPDIYLNQSETSIGYFVRRSREVSKSLCRSIEIRALHECTEAISEFAEYNLSGDLLKLKEDVRDLIRYSHNISRKEKERLVKSIDEHKDYAFLKDVLVFILKNTTNIKVDFKKMNVKKLRRAIIDTDNNAKLERLCLVALDMKEENLMHLCLEKMGNNVHISRLVQYLIDIEFDNDTSVEDIADRLVSRLDNNIYIEKVIRAYIAKKSFSREAKRLFLEKHISQLDNNKYLFSVLKFLWEEDFVDEVRKYGKLLTNETHIKKLDILTKNE